MSAVLINAASLADVEALIRQATGMAAETLGASTIESALKRRLQASNLQDATSYMQHLQGSPSEIQALIDEVVVPETWFFRNLEAFDALAAKAVAKIANSGCALRLLSLPCSSGEEPLSMAMALFDAGVAAQFFEIDAVDISAKSLALAADAGYNSNSFRGKQLAFRERYFTQHNKDYVVAPHVKARVQYQLANMLSPSFMPEAGIYDFIFCRNVLIYFDRETQDKAVNVLMRLLKKDGMIFVGPSESSLMLEHGFASSKQTLAFAFVKKSTATKAVPIKSVPVKPAVEALAKTKTVQPIIAPLKAATPTRDKAQASNQTAAVLADSLSEISTLADQGNLSAALARCEQLLTQSKPNAQLFYLTGLVHDSSGAPAPAEQYYRKALYLEPNHHEAIHQLAYMLEKRGDVTAAENLRQRAKRLNA